MQVEENHHVGIAFLIGLSAMLLAYMLSNADTLVCTFNFCMIVEDVA